MLVIPPESRIVWTKVPRWWGETEVEIPDRKKTPWEVNGCEYVIPIDGMEAMGR